MSDVEASTEEGDINVSPEGDSAADEAGDVPAEDDTAPEAPTEGDE
jgi:hypothetical protein